MRGKSSVYGIRACLPLEYSTIRISPGVSRIGYSTQEPAILIFLWNPIKGIFPFKENWYKNSAAFRFGIDFFCCFITPYYSLITQLEGFQLVALLRAC